MTPALRGMAARRALAFAAECLGSRVASPACLTTRSFASAATEASAGTAQAAPPTRPFTLLDSRVQGAYHVPLRPVFAVVELAGTQYKVTPNDTIITEKLVGVDVADRLTLDRVLLAGTPELTLIGRPTLPAVTVTAAVEVRRVWVEAGRGSDACAGACGGVGSWEEGGRRWDCHMRRGRRAEGNAAAVSSPDVLAATPPANCDRSNSWMARSSSFTSAGGRTRGG